MSSPSVVIIGAGPAGLSAALEVTRQGGRPIVLEASGMVGGISRTEEYNGYLCDVGGHRFFTQNRMVRRMWADTLSDSEFLSVRRQSRIYHKGRFFDYPLRPMNTLSNLGLVESLRILVSFAGTCLSPHSEENTFEQWVCNRFGKRLYHLFFKGYTEKVWGISCSELRADWATQRIKGLSLVTAVSNALFKGGDAKSLIETFHYPVRGPGMIWARFGRKVEDGGGQVLLNARVKRLIHTNNRITAIDYTHAGETKSLSVEHLISSMPITELVNALSPEAPERVRTAGRGVSYRAFVMVLLIVDQPALFPDQWIYIQPPDVNVGRIQNFKNWSGAMVPDADVTSLGMEYFCNQGDAIWQMPDHELIDLAGRELRKLGLDGGGNVIGGTVIRQSKAYPIYDSGHKERLAILREHVQTYDNLQTVGRNGMHRYNNQDHAMLTGIMAARNVLGASYDPWEVNEEDVYLEEDRQTQQRRRQLIVRAFLRMDPIAFGIATGIVAGLFLFIVTIWPVILGNQAIKPYLALLGQYFSGYAPTVPGACMGWGYGFLVGSLLGWSLSALRNQLLVFYIHRIKRRAANRSRKDFLDHV